MRLCSSSVRRRRWLPGLLLAGLALASVRPTAAVQAQPTRDTTFAVANGAFFEVSSRSAEITVRGSNSREVRVQALGSGTVDISGSDRSVRISGENTRSRGIDEIRLDVPQGITLLVRTQNGDVVVRGTQGDVEVHSTSGDITVSSAARVVLDNVTGDIIAADITDGLRIGTTSGDIDIANVIGDLDVGGTSAQITVRDAQSRRVQLKVVSGDLEFTGVLVDGGRYDFSTHSGDVRLSVPRTSRAALDIQTFNGEISTADLPLTLMPDPAASAAAEQERELEQDRRDIQSARDSLRRRMRDSLRRLDEPRSARDSASFERNVERSVERLVSSLLNTISKQLESVAIQFDGRKSGQALRFQLGESGGPLVTISTFSGDIRIGSEPLTRRRR